MRCGNFNPQLRHLTKPHTAVQHDLDYDEIVPASEMSHPTNDNEQFRNSPVNVNYNEVSLDGNIENQPLLSAYYCICCIWYYSQLQQQPDQTQRSLYQQVLQHSISDSIVEVSNQNVYTDISKHKKALKYFQDNFTMNLYGYSCAVCDRLWHKQKLRKLTGTHAETLIKCLQVILLLSFILLLVLY